MHIRIWQHRPRPSVITRLLYDGEDADNGKSTISFPLRLRKDEPLPSRYKRLPHIIRLGMVRHHRVILPEDALPSYSQYLRPAGDNRNACLLGTESTGLLLTVANSPLSNVLFPFRLDDENCGIL